MAEVTLAGGLAIDLATREDLEEHHELLRRLIAPPDLIQRFTRLPGAGKSTAGPVLVNLGQPPSGLIWLPQWAIFTGNDEFGAAVANVTAALYMGGGRPPGSVSGNAPTLGTAFSDCIIPAAPVPSVQNIPDKMVCYPTEALYAIFNGTGLVAGAANYHVVVGVIEATHDEAGRYLSI